MGKTILPCIQEVIITSGLSIAINSDNLAPNPLGTDYVMPVATGGVVTLATAGIVLHADTTHVHIRSEVAPMRVTWNGTTPTAGSIPPGVGEPLLSNDMGYFLAAAINAAQFIANTATTGYVQISEWMVP